jgi:cobyrinic acid a,c-diamide synthase
MSVSVAALIKGFLELRSDHGIRGVILNRIPPTLYSDIKTLIEKELPVEVLGYLPHMDDAGWKAALWLVTAGEIGNLKQITEKISKQMERSVDLDRILEIASEAPA